MARTDENRRRTAPFMTGSVAYDLSRQSQAAEKYSTAPELNPRPERRRREQAAPRPAAHRVMAVAPTAIVLSLIALVFWVFTLQVKTQISQAQTEIYHLESELRAVEQVQDELEIQYESAFSFTQMEDYAVGTLGMQRPRDEQIYYLSHTAEDHPVAVAHNASANGLVDRFSDLVSELVSYFR